MDIQKFLDEWLDGNAQVSQYVTAVYYLDEGETIPPDVTHVVSLASKASLDRTFRVGLAVIPRYAFMVDAMLALIATSPQP
jgi:hypothetical protein